MKKKGNNILIIGIILIFFLSLYIWGYNQKDFNLELMSIVQERVGVSFIDITVTATNDGNVDLNCYPISATPSAFDSSLDKNTKVVQVDGKASWTSNLISVGQFEGAPTPDRFEVTLRCSYNTGREIIELPEKTGFIDLVILGEKMVKFRTNTAYGVCKSYELGNAWIAFDHDEDGTMTGFGKTTGSCLEYDCSDSQYGLGNAGSTPEGCKLWIRDSETICVCSGLSKARKYTTSDSDASNAVLNINSISPYNDKCMEIYSNQILSCKESPYSGSGNMVIKFRQIYTVGDIPVSNVGWIAIDINMGDNILEAFGFGTTKSCSNQDPRPEDILLYTPEGYPVTYGGEYYGVYIWFQTIDGGVDIGCSDAGAFVFEADNTIATEAKIITSPIEPYASNGQEIFV